MDMNWGGPGFVLALIAISTAGWVITTWIRARHGYPVENEWRGQSEKIELVAERRIALLTNENAALTDRLGRLEERLATMERIVTDPAERTARAIDRLAD
jgi:hypothetical protein